jgi:segregation and condensation protein A
MPLDDVQIRLDAFEGPLDLLLHLIRKSEVEITDIPIAKITEQYLATLSGLGDAPAEGDHNRIDVETAGEFLVMAATLMEIKSKMLMPALFKGAEGPEAAATDATSAAPAAPAEDPRSELVRQLLAYKRFRDAAGTLERRAQDWGSRFPAAGAAQPHPTAQNAAEADETPVEIDDLTITDLTRAFAAIMETVDFTRLGEHRVTDDETPVELHAADLIDRLTREGTPGKDGEREMEFAKVFAGRTKSEMIGLFLALLEMIRQRRLRAHQEAIHGTIMIGLIADPEGPATTTQE